MLILLFINTMKCRHLHYLKLREPKFPLLSKKYTGNDIFVRTDQDMIISFCFFFKAFLLFSFECELSLKA